MKPILYSTSPDARAAFVRAHWADLREKMASVGPDEVIRHVVYLVPRKFLADAQARLSDMPEAYFLAYEDLTKSNEVFNRANGATLLVLDRPSRYKNITTDTFVRLSRAAALYQHKILVDIVPFTAEVQYLYCPLALINRGILGYQHWYSFRENNLEMLADGTQVRAHTPALLAAKMAPHAAMDDTALLNVAWETIHCPLDMTERADYQALRDRLFATNTSASPIITTLADWTHIRPSRYAQLQALLATHSGAVVVYTNLASHNRRLAKILPGVQVKSFYDTNGDEEKYDLVVLFELPITKSYLFLDVLANVRPGCRIVVFRDETTVATLLYKRLSEECMGIHDLTQALRAELAVMV